MSGYLKYKGYLGSVEYSADDQCLFGKLAFIGDLVNYEAVDVIELEQAFKDAVEHYLASCKKLDIEPKKPCKGTFNVRISPDLHQKAVVMAGDRSLNSFVTEAIEQHVERVA